MNMRNTINSLLLITVMILGISLNAQDLNTAIDRFNEGNQAVQADNKRLAIEKYKLALEIAGKLGAEGDEIVAATMGHIPSLFYQIGVQEHRDNNTDQAIDEFQNAIKYGKEFGDNETVQRATELIPRLYLSKGNELFRNNVFEEALENYKLAAELDPSYARAFWSQGLSYNRLNKTEEMEAAFSKGRELAQAEGDDALVDRINTTAKRFLQAEGAGKLQAQRWAEALKYLNASNEYVDDDPETFYYLALANNGLSKWDDAAKAALRGLELSEGKPAETKAKFYFEMGNALKGAGKTTQACEAYASAQHGRFVENAKYEREVVLKCN